MEAHQMPLYQFLEGSGKVFVIPVYQRDYAWTRIQCQKLWEDLVFLSKNTRADHFLGTIVTVGSGYEEYSIIDGQQRLTTASLLLVALHNALKIRPEKTAEEQILQDQSLDFLINKYSPSSEKRIRLKPNKQDKIFFEQLFEPAEEHNAASNIVSNYRFFLDKIQEGVLGPREIFDAFKKLKIVLIGLVRGQDDPQLIFESLNSTGVDLTAGDLIRNYILMDLEPDAQERLYAKYWTEIESLSGDVAEFTRNYLTYRTRTSVKKDDVYSTFKKTAIEDFDADKMRILEELVTFARMYSQFVQNRMHGNPAVNEGLRRIHKLEFTVCYPYLFDVFHEVALKNLTDETAATVLRIIESFAFRKILVDNSTQGLNKLFVTLAKEIKKEEGWHERYVDILSYVLLGKGASQRFPDDAEFESALINKEVYKMQSKNRNFLLESLENYGTPYQIDLENSESLTVEHVMPQTLTNAWKTKLGEHWAEVHGKYVHTLGNLTLTARNSALSNNSFEEKQRIDFQTSKLKLNFKVDGVERWTETEILDRAKLLIKDASKIWPYPTTTFSKQAPEEQLFDLASEDSFSGYKPHRLYLGERTPVEVKSWRELLVLVCTFLHDFSPTRFQELQRSAEFAWCFSPPRPVAPLEFAPGAFVEAHQSSNSIVRLLSSLCERMHYPQEDVQFSLKE